MDAIVDIDLHEWVDELEVPCCESTLHVVEWRLPPHEAHWYASAPCMSLVAVCDDRRRKCRRDGAWRCISGCSAEHPYEHIEWTPVRIR